MSVATAGAVQLGFALVLFIRPTAVIDHWAWPLTPLTARTLSAFVAFLAVQWLCFLFDDRWSSFEVPMQTVTLGLVLVAAGTVLQRSDLTGPTAAVRAFQLSIGTAIVLVVALQVVMRRRLVGVASPPVRRSGSG